MPGIKHYIDKEQAAKLKAEAEKLGIDIELLIQIKLRSSTSDNENLSKEIANLAERVKNCELLLKKSCLMTSLTNEIGLSDLGYLRGAIEVQAQRNTEAVKRAKEKEQQRLELSKKVRQEIEQYLL